MRPRKFNTQSVHKCPACNSGLVYVADSRPLSPDRDIPVIRRSRRCRECGHRWGTYEMPADIFEGLRVALAPFSFIQPNKGRADEAKNGSVLTSAKQGTTA